MVVLAAELEWLFVLLGIFGSNEGTARAVLTTSNDGSALPTQNPGPVVIGFDAGRA